MLICVDARALIKTDGKFMMQPIEQVSKKNVVQFFKQHSDKVNIITGFIGSNNKNEATTLGRNGSNLRHRFLII